jgi:hypothetical protein
MRVTIRFRLNSLYLNRRTGTCITLHLRVLSRGIPKVEASLANNRRNTIADRLGRSNNIVRCATDTNRPRRVLALHPQVRHDHADVEDEGSDGDAEEEEGGNYVGDGRRCSGLVSGVLVCPVYIRGPGRRRWGWCDEGL